MTDSGWPELTFEKRPWEPRLDQPMSRRARLAARGPYRTAVPGTIAEAHPALDADTLAHADDASRELARFDAESGAFAAPFAAVLLRTESASSSEIERITTSAKQLALADLGAARSGNARLVRSNVEAMQAAIAFAENLDAQAIIEMQRALLEHSSPEQVGAWRDEQVWIGGGAFSPHNADFVPPHHERVPALMDDLVRFLARTDLPVIVHAALAHAQFETVHPFTDGNGRTGRALVHGMLRAAGATQNVAVPVSAGLLANVDAYFDALTQYRRGDPAAIVNRMSEATFAGVGNGRTLVTALRETRSAWAARVRARSDSAAWRLLDLAVQQPVLDVATVSDRLGVTPAAATAALTRLEEAEVLTRANSGARNRLWQAPDVLDALEAFATRARRRGAGASGIGKSR